VFANELDVLAYRERYKDLVREAEKARLVRQIRAERERQSPTSGRLLTWLGRRLVVWGWRLQGCCDCATAAPVLRGTERVL
jgi:hypothetical protein